MSSGLILGKFMPPHLGHKYLIDFARSAVDDLTVQVCSIASEPIPGALRYQWVRSSFGDVRVVHNDDANPQVPEDCPAHFWDIWRESLLRRMEGGKKPDFLFASETYGFRLAEALGARYVPVDQSRELVPISGTAIRKEPMRHWEMILPEARPYFLKRVAILGPESSGKSMLAAFLAAHYQTRHVAEYGRAYVDAVSPNFDEETFLAILHGHRASEEAMARQANRVLFSDTESIVTKLWAQILLGFVPPSIEEAVQNSRYDLYLVTSTTEQWADDAQRFQPELAARQAFEENCLHLLNQQGRNHVILKGDWKQRQQQAVSAVDALLDKKAGWG